MNSSTDPLHIVSPRVVENNLEFSRAASGTKLLLSALSQLLKGRLEHKLTGRLIAVMRKVIQSDTVNGRGERTPSAGDITLLEGFDFYRKKPLHRLLHVPLDISIDRKTGVCTVQTSPFDALVEMRYDNNHTHVKFIVAVAELDFDREKFVTDIAHTGYQDIKQPMIVSLQARFPARSRLPVVLVIGIELSQEVNGRHYTIGGIGPLTVHVIQSSNAPRT